MTEIDTLSRNMHPAFIITPVARRKFDGRCVPLPPAAGRSPLIAIFARIAGASHFPDEVKPWLIAMKPVDGAAWPEYLTRMLDKVTPADAKALHMRGKGEVISLQDNGQLAIRPGTALDFRTAAEAINIARAIPRHRERGVRFQGEDRDMALFGLAARDFGMNVCPTCQMPASDFDGLEQGWSAFRASPAAHPLARL